jgi:hypothetical protein
LGGKPSEVSEAITRADLRDGGAVCTIQQAFPRRRQAQPPKITQRRKTEEDAKVFLQRAIGYATGRNKISHRDLPIEAASHVIDGSHDVVGERPIARRLDLIVMIRRCHRR